MKAQVYYMLEASVCVKCMEMAEGYCRKLLDWRPMLRVMTAMYFC